MEGREKGEVMGVSEQTGLLAVPNNTEGHRTGTLAGATRGGIVFLEVGPSGSAAQGGPRRGDLEALYSRRTWVPRRAFFDREGWSHYNSRPRKQIGGAVSVEMKRGAKIYSATVPG